MMRLPNIRIRKRAVLPLVVFIALLIILASSQGPGQRFLHPETNVPIGPEERVTNLGNVTIGKKVATITDTRYIGTLVPLILHFSAVLGPEWPIIVFTSPEPPSIFNAGAIQKLINAGQLQIVPLSPSVKFDNLEDVSRYLASRPFWEFLAPAEHVLVFQADSVICGNSKNTIEDYLEYDFIGAPVSPYFGDGFNGGLSLRNRQVMLKIMEEYDWSFLEPEDKDYDVHFIEDQWFYRKMLELPPKEDGSPGVNLPSFELASTFAVEAMWYDRPFGFHQVLRWQHEHIAEVSAYCPEWTLTKAGFGAKE